jgi:hypothetical protein
MNGQIIYQAETLKEKLEGAIEEAKEGLNKMNRESRRHPNFKKVLVALSFLGTIGLTAVTQANAMGVPATAPIAPTAPSEGLFNDPLHHPLLFALGFLSNKLTGQEMNLAKEDSMIWKLNEFMSTTLFTTHNFFGDASIVGIFNIIWQIMLSLVMLMISKKGFDMIKSRVVGGQSGGATEFIVRLLASCLMSFLTLDIIGLGINLSNITTGVIMKAMAGGSVHFNSMLAGLADGTTASLFWLIAFIILFVILGVRYWMRQINLVILGCVAPVANMAWVTDGGAMLGTLIKEIVLSLTTPIVQTLVLGIGTTILMEAGNATSMGFLNSILIGLSTLVTMVTVPDFLRKFATGSANPFKSAAQLYLQAKGIPGKFLKAFK